jgi:hypothetical protein
MKKKKIRKIIKDNKMLKRSATIWQPWRKKQCGVARMPMCGSDADLSPHV